MLAALQDFGFGAVAPPLEELATKDKVFMLGEKPYRIDVLTTISGVEFAQAWKDRVFLDLEMGTIPTIDRQSLIRNKRASGRPKDLADLAMLEASMPEGP